MRRILMAITALALVSGATAQIEHGGEPLSWNQKLIGTDVDYYQTEAIDLDLAKSQDLVTDQYKETVYRFGIDHEVDIDFFQEATRTQLKGDNFVWRLGIECPEALSVNFLVDNFFIPEGGKMFVYSPETKEKKGAFTAENNRENHIFPVGLIGGSKIVIEYVGTLGDEATIHISQITHGYRSVLGYADVKKGPFGSSAACNINVNCPEGDPWPENIRTVGIIVQGGGVCTGSLVNNVEQDETPLFLTANHCLGNPSNWMYYFNHESAGCTGSTGPTGQSVSGGTLLASNSGSDFALVQLNSNVPASFEPCFAGYNTTDALTPTSAIGIHHPGGDVKKICFENNAPFHQSVNFNGNANTGMWYINQWELGVTEPGSSGSPLFDQDGRVIGVLSGGAAACNGPVNNGQYDFYGRLGVAWDGTAASNRLKDHLDPNNSGIQITEMYCPYDVILANDAAGQGISNVPEILCDLTPFSPTFTLRNAGSNTLTSATINYTYNGTDQTPIAWTGSLVQGASESITLGSFSPINGNNTMFVTVSNPNGGADDNTANNSSTANVATAEVVDDQWTITLTTDDYGYETYWQIKQVGGAVIASGGNPGVGADGGGAQTAAADDAGAYANNETIEEVVIIPANGCFEFLIVDDYGDGMCCQYGDGSFSVTDGSGTTIAAGGEYDNSVAEIRGVLFTGLDESDLSHDISFYPNPTADELNISLGKEIGAYSISVINALGQEVKAVRVNGDLRYLLDVSEMATGNYVLRIFNEDYNGVRRFTVK